MDYVINLTYAEYNAALKKRDDEIDALIASLYQMLDAYWGKGDGEAPPAFIKNAANLCGYELTN